MRKLPNAFTALMSMTILLIIHCGTNNLMTDQAEACVDKIKNLVGKVITKFPNSSIGVSSLTYREDINVDLIRVEVNDQLKRLAHDNNFQFIDNSVVDSTCLNNSNFHLNAKGTSLRAVDQFIRFYGRLYLTTNFLRVVNRVFGCH